MNVVELALYAFKQEFPGCFEERPHICLGQLYSATSGRLALYCGGLDECLRQFWKALL